MKRLHILSLILTFLAGSMPAAGQTATDIADSARVLLRNIAFDRAIIFLESGTRAHDNSAELFRLLAQAYQGRGNREGVIGALESPRLCPSGYRSRKHNSSFPPFTNLH
jgi:hypothetical protein